MKTGLALKLGQQLAMTPQLQQAIRLLQLSSLDLQMEIQNIVESNPLLELSEEYDVASASSLSEHSDTSLDGPDQHNIEQDYLEQNFSHEQTRDETTSLNFKDDDATTEIPIDYQWNDIYPTASDSASGGDNIDPFHSVHHYPTLAEQLESQLNLINLSQKDHAIAYTLIHHLNEEGYLLQPLADLLPSFPDHWQVEVDEVLAMLHLVQSFDPTGVGAQSLQECLALQLRHHIHNCMSLSKKLRDESVTMVELHRKALQLVEEHFDLIAQKNWNSIKQKTHWNDTDLKMIMECIRRLNPRPGQVSNPIDTSSITPDVVIKKKQGRWRVELNEDNLPKLKVNTTYSAMIRRADTSETNLYLKNHLQEAKWFIKSLQSRHETLLKVATQIVKHQRTFFDYGEVGMKPLILNEVAEALGLHESTISRVTNQKYMHTPRGVFELKYFFSSHLGTSEGGECSSTAIKAMIKQLVTQENASKPLSDSKIVDFLQEKGIAVARRTVAKYRDNMGILGSSERKQTI